jgi:hypothetical protein
MPSESASDHVAGVPTPAGGLVLYTRARCGVCHRAEEQVRRELGRVRRSRRVPLTLVDVDEAGLDGRFGVRVPVLMLDGVELSELELAPGVVRRALRERARALRARGQRARGLRAASGGS